MLIVVVGSSGEYTYLGCSEIKTIVINLTLIVHCSSFKNSQHPPSPRSVFPAAVEINLAKGCIMQFTTGSVYVILSYPGMQGSFVKISQEGERGDTSLLIK